MKTKKDNILISRANGYHDTEIPDRAHNGYFVILIIINLQNLDEVSYNLIISNISRELLELYNSR
jgi:hypothetical protein